MEVPPETPEEVEQLQTRRVHMLGLGSIGTLIAHSLRCLPNAPPLTLLMHRPDMYEHFKEGGKTIRLINPNTQVNDEQRGFDVEVLESDDNTQKAHWRHIPADSSAEPLRDDELIETGETYIYTLVVSVKGPATVSALASVKHRIDGRSTICLMQNGMGQIDELNKRVFTNPATRPTYMLGIVSHGAYMQSHSTVVHAGFGSTALGIWRDPDKYPLPPASSALVSDDLSAEDQRRMYPSESDLYSNLSSRYLLRTLTRSPILACASFPYLDLMQLQLEKLAMNAVLNPLTALLDVPNGSTLKEIHLTRTSRLLLAEISLVICSLPELEGIPGVKLRFSSERLETLLIGITKKTAKNSSSMREDIRNLRQTEIEYINGYVVRRGEQLGINCVLNYMLMQLVKAKVSFTRSGPHQSYGVSMIEQIGDNPEQVVLEDKGTNVAGQAY